MFLGLAAVFYTAFFYKMCRVKLTEKPFARPEKIIGDGWVKYHFCRVDCFLNYLIKCAVPPQVPSHSINMRSFS
jgi:hypothetical protein